MNYALDIFEPISGYNTYFDRGGDYVEKIENL